METSKEKVKKGKWRSIWYKQANNIYIELKSKIESRVHYIPEPAWGQEMSKKGKGSPYSITERMVQELIPVLDSQPVGDVNHKPDSRLPLLSWGI